MPRLPADLEETLAQYARGPSLVRAALSGAGPAELSRPGSGGWSVRDVLVHLADAELVRAARLRFILADEAPPVLPAFDEERWKRRLSYLWRSPEAALALYDALVFSNLELLRQCDAAAFGREGIVAGEPVSAAELVRRGAAHGAEHAAQVRALRG
ncbi:DinB family protein [Tepidiforma sp.]|uniref:DinB family protein n=1 Tax=Tepidiforma sp. TaxID=2682230 RepID=UPI0021DD0C99|nr:DinB family protein [Tepidiforma sp.]MCX7616776.1 DinB family protein [Tepidiforma sp.]GIW19493.1 MAG: hypothetical protein KatS3mg064_2650 [Tepidiforma sp.]